MKRLAVAVVVTALLVLAAAPAHAADAPTPAARVTLLEQPAYTTLGGDVPLRLAITGPVNGLEARAIVHASMTSRTGFERTVVGDSLGSTVEIAGDAAAALPE